MPPFLLLLALHAPLLHVALPHAVLRQAGTWLACLLLLPALLLRAPLLLLLLLAWQLWTVYLEPLH